MTLLTCTCGSGPPCPATAARTCSPPPAQMHLSPAAEGATRPACMKMKRSARLEHRMRDNLVCWAPSLSSGSPGCAEAAACGPDSGRQAHHHCTVALGCLLHHSGHLLSCVFLTRHPYKRVCRQGSSVGGRRRYTRRNAQLPVQVAARVPQIALSCPQRPTTAGAEPGSAAHPS